MAPVKSPATHAISGLGCYNFPEGGDAANSSTFKVLSVYSYLELVELPNGDIVLQRTEGEGEPLVTIRFSSESRDYLAGAPLEVARVMIQAGINATSELPEDPLADEAELDEVTEEPKTLH